MSTKICVYAIAKDEEQFVDRFMDGVADADLVVVGDTGSTDGTAQKLRDRGAHVIDIRIDPWRFDEARNKVLDFVPPEYDCLFSLDLDEFPDSGWYDKVAAAWKPGVSRLRYMYQWGPDRQFLCDKIHSRDYKWVSPCHEVLEPGVPAGTPVVDFEVIHKPDPAKSRGSYLALLALAVSERPKDDRVLHYYGRELYFRGQDQEATVQLQKHADIETAWPAERAASCRMLAEIIARGRCGDPRPYYQRGCDIAPDQREPYMFYAQYLTKIGDVVGAAELEAKARGITQRQHHYLEHDWCWGDAPEIACDINGLISEVVSAWGAKDYARARRAHVKARELDPDNASVRANRMWFPEPRFVTLAYADAKISVLVVSHGRPDLASRVIETAMSTATRPELVEVLPMTDLSDARHPEYALAFGPESVGTEFPTSRKWNTLAKRATGDIIMLTCDDVIFESKGWDEVLRRAWPDDGIAVAYPNTGGAGFCEFPIVSRKMADALGYVAYPELKHSGLDMWWQLIGEDLGRLLCMGKLWTLIHAHEEYGEVRNRAARYAADKEEGEWSLDYKADVRTQHTEILRGLTQST